MPHYSLCHYFIFSWKKPAREDLTTQQYFEDFRIEQSRPDDWINVYRGLGDEDFPELRGSMRGASSILQRFSLGSAASKTSQHASIDQQSLLSEDLLKQQHIADSEEEDDANLQQVQISRM